MRRLLLKARFSSLPAFGMVIALSLTAGAQQADDKAAAEVLFNDGRALLKADKFELACPKLAESQRLDPALGTLGWLAQCYEKTGKTASAWAAYRELYSLAHRGNEKEREAMAKQRAEALEPHLSKLTISVPPESQLPDLEVRRNGTLVGSAQWGSAFPVDPGVQTITVAANGYQTISLQSDVGSDGATAAVSIPKLVANPSPATSPVVPQQSAAASVSAAPPVDEGAARGASNAGNSQRIAGYSVGALGVVSLGVGVGFLIDKNSKESKADKLCPGPCADVPTHDQWQSLIDGADRSGTISLVTGIAGGALLATGIVLIVTSPSSKSSSSWLVAPVVAHNHGGAVIEGTW